MQCSPLVATKTKNNSNRLFPNTCIPACTKASMVWHHRYPPNIYGIRETGILLTQPQRGATCFPGHHQLHKEPDPPPPKYARAASPANPNCGALLPFHSLLAEPPHLGPAVREHPPQTPPPQVFGCRGSCGRDRRLFLPRTIPRAQLSRLS